MRPARAWERVLSDGHDKVIHRPTAADTPSRAERAPPVYGESNDRDFDMVPRHPAPSTAAEFPVVGVFSLRYHRHRAVISRLSNLASLVSPEARAPTPITSDPDV